MQKQYIYRVCIKSDQGKFTVDTMADSAKTARHIVCKAENAPLTAVIATTRMQLIYKPCNI
jgi:hypothetical protein